MWTVWAAHVLFDAIKLYPKKLPDTGYIRSKKIILCFVSVAYLLGLMWGGGGLITVRIVSR